MSESTTTSGSGWVLQSGLPLPDLQAAISSLHQAEAQERARQHDAIDLMDLKVPTERWMNLREAQRRDWCDYVARRDDIQPVVRRTISKSDLLMKFVAENVGVVYTIQALAQAADCSESTVHKVISDNPHHFKKGMFAGTYQLLDPAAEREREAELLATPPSVPPPERTDPARTQPASDPFLAILNGDTDKEKSP